MTVEELNTELYERMFEEQEQFRSELLGKSPQKVLDHAYDYEGSKKDADRWLDEEGMAERHEEKKRRREREKEQQYPRRKPQSHEQGR